MSEKAKLEGCLKAAIGVLLIPPFMLWKGYVLSTLWAWFAVPLGAPPVTTLQAIGVSLVAAFLRPFPKAYDNFDLAEHIGRGLFDPALYLGVGWCVQVWL